MADRAEAALPADAAGTCTVVSRHTTAVVAVNEAEPRLLSDVEAFLADVVPNGGWRHDELDDDTVSSLRS